MPSDLDDYYAPHPRLVLSKSVVLAGQIGCGAGAIARNVAGRTGLGFAPLDRMIEHEQGSRLGRIVADHGPEHLEALATDALERLLGRRPYGLIVLGRAWPSLSAAERLAEAAYLMRIDRDSELLRSRVRDGVAREGLWWLGPGVEAALEATGEIDWERLWGERRALLDEADGVLEAGALHENELAERVLAALRPALSSPPR